VTPRRQDPTFVPLATLHRASRWHSAVDGPGPRPRHAARVAAEARPDPVVTARARLPACSGDRAVPRPGVRSHFVLGDPNLMGCARVRRSLPRRHHPLAGAPRRSGWAGDARTPPALGRPTDDPSHRRWSRGGNVTRTGSSRASAGVWPRPPEGGPSNARLRCSASAQRDAPRSRHPLLWGRTRAEQHAAAGAADALGAPRGTAGRARTAPRGFSARARDRGHREHEIKGHAVARAGSERVP
jgi:hypothetical protein